MALMSARRSRVGGSGVKSVTASVTVQAITFSGGKGLV
jgi:hypothetical protein